MSVATVRVGLGELASAWGAYVGGEITRRQFRCWLAALEVGVRERFSRQVLRVKDYAALLGLAPRSVAFDLRRLREVGLLRFTTKGVRLCDSELSGRAAECRGAMLAGTTSRRAALVPRRLLRRLLRGFRRASVAALLAACLRCVWVRGGAVETEGRLQVTAAARCMSVARQTLVSGMAALVKGGVLERLGSSWWAARKWGQRYRLLGCERARFANSTKHELAPDLGAQDQERCPLKTGEVQKPALPTRRVVAHQRAWLRTPSAVREYGEGLARRGRLRAKGNVGFDLLCLAEHAARVGRAPMRLFGWLVRNWKTAHVTHADEEAVCDRRRGELGSRAASGEEPRQDIPSQLRAEWDRDNAVAALAHRLRRTEAEVRIMLRARGLGLGEPAW